jgi:rare lipoprotein A
MVRRAYQQGIKMMKIFAGLIAASIFGATAASAATGYASYYKSGKLTANGERYIPSGLTAAHRQLPFGTKLKVTNLRNGKTVIVRVNDRGPFVRKRILDLSFGAAKAIGLQRAGIGKIQYDIVE